MADAIYMLAESTICGGYLGIARTP